MIYPHKGVNFDHPQGAAVRAILPPNTKHNHATPGRSCTRGDEMGCGAPPGTGTHLHYGTHIQPITAPKPGE